MTRNTTRINFTKYLLLWTAVFALVAFCLAIALVRSRQHIMKHGYFFINLEHVCSLHNRKISELDRTILSMAAKSKGMERDRTTPWRQESMVVHISKRDVHSYALANGKKYLATAAIAENFSGTN